MSKHTPGPWIVTTTTISNTLFVDAAEENIYRPVARIERAQGRNKECREANARLIAASPKTLTALKQARSRIPKMQSEGYPQDHTLALIESAINEAEIEQPDTSPSEKETK